MSAVGALSAVLREHATALLHAWGARAGAAEPRVEVDRRASAAAAGDLAFTACARLAHPDPAVGPGPPRYGSPPRPPPSAPSCPSAPPLRPHQGAPAGGYSDSNSEVKRKIAALKHSLQAKASGVHKRQTTTDSRRRSQHRRTAD